MYKNLSYIYNKVANEPCYSSMHEAFMDGAFGFVGYAVKGDALQEAELQAASTLAVIPCEMCGRDVRDVQPAKNGLYRVGWLELDFGPELAVHGWFRLCWHCYKQVEIECQHIPNGTWPTDLRPKILLSVSHCTDEIALLKNPPYHLAVSKPK